MNIKHVVAVFGGQLFGMFLGCAIVATFYKLWVVAVPCAFAAGFSLAVMVYVLNRKEGNDDEGQ